MDTPLYKHEKFTGNDSSRVTVAAVRDEDGNMSFGAARCSNEDMFCRNKGRKIALGRAKSKKARSLTLPVADWNDYRAEFQIGCRKVIMEVQH